MATRRKKTPGKAMAARKGTNVVNIDQQLSQEAEGIMDTIGTPATNSISVKDKMFSFPDGTVDPGPIQIVIVDYLSKNMFYQGKWDPKNPQPPVCFAIGTKPKELIPSANSPEAQCSDCASCALNQFGSDGDGKACKNTRFLAVLPADAEADTPIMTLSVSPTAIKNFDAYVATIAKLFQAPPLKVITEVSFHPEKTHAQLVFGNPQPNPDYATHFARREEARVLLNTEPDTSSYVSEKPKKRAGGRRR